MIGRGSSVSHRNTLRHGSVVNFKKMHLHIKINVLQ